VNVFTLTLAHQAAVHKLDAALGSAPYADRHVVLDTSPGDSGVRQAVARSPVRNKIFVSDWPWRQDFAAARNALLDAAAGLAAGTPTCGIMLDTDERLVCPDVERLQAELQSRGDAIGLAFNRQHGYAKERACNLATKARYVGRIHETATIGFPCYHMTSMRFEEDDKTPKEYQAKAAREEVLLLEETAEHPLVSRWWYYLGEAHEGLKKSALAFSAYKRCIDLRGWDEEGAWASFRAAKLLLLTSDPALLAECVEICARGLARHSGFPELCCVAGVACMQLGQHDKARNWAHMAIALGDHNGCRASRNRTMFKDLPSLYEMPYEILKVVGDGEERALSVNLAALASRHGL